MVTERQEEILDRTLELVRESGLAGLTIRKIAERVGFTEAAVYRHFPSKRALLAGLIQRLDGILLEPIRALAEGHGRSPRKRLEEALAHHERIILETDSLPILLLAEVVATGDAELVGGMRRVLSGYLALLAGMIRQAREREGVEGDLPPDMANLLLLGLPAALAIRHRLLPEEDPEPQTLAALTEKAVTVAIGLDGPEDTP